MLRLGGRPRHDAWGSVDALPDLLGVRPDGRPHSELWFGAHPAAPSWTAPAVTLSGPGSGPAEGAGLDRVVAADAQQAMGTDVCARFGKRLPYLVKILAAALPLSLQVHPDAARAREGHADEQARQVPSDERRYADPWHKPELLVALAPTLALAGLREPEDAAGALAALDLPRDAGPAAAGGGVAGVVAALLRPGDPAERTAEALRRALALPPDVVAGVARAVAGIPASPSPSPGAEAARLVARAWPTDPGLVASFLLHAVRLAPGEALYVAPGVLHCYVTGLGLEVMAASDTVLRAGLTRKLVDVPELMRVVGTRVQEAPVVGPVRSGGPGVVERLYVTAAEEFEVRVLDVRTDGSSGEVVPGGPGRGPRVVLCLDGLVAAATDGSSAGLRAGEGVFVLDADGAVRLSGHGRAAVVSVPPAPSGAF